MASQRTFKSVQAGSIPVQGSKEMERVDTDKEDWREAHDRR